MKSINILFILVTVILCTVSAESIIPPPPRDQCLAPNNEPGLGPALRELIDLLPTVDLLKIYIYAVSNDAEVQEIIEFIEGPKIRQIIITMHNTPEFSDTMEYICEKLYFDAYFYLNSLGGLFDFPPMTRPPPSRSNHESHSKDLRYKPGFKGFLEEIQDVLPIEKLNHVYKKRLAEDTYFQLFMKKLGSKEFRKVGYVIQALPEFEEFLQKLRDTGVDADQILKDIMDFFGWEE